MTANELRQKYLEFFQSKNHARIPSASLIPENDATVLFTMAGMHPLVPYLTGERHPLGNRLVDCQKCIRTGDIDDVGDNRHLTFFEMLGNWSLGNYFKKEAIAWSFEFLTKSEWLDLDPKRIFVTVFGGDAAAPRDDESIGAWQKEFNGANLQAEVSESGVWDGESVRIFALGAEDNWWGLATGPGGPCTEMFYDTAPERGFENKSFAELVKDGRFFEIWNDVFMEYNKSADGALTKLTEKNVDTGMGLERTVAVLNGFAEVFDIDEFQILFQKIETLSGKSYADFPKAFRIIADHLRAATFILGDEKSLPPSNVGAGYILRRLIRRAIRYGRQLGINNFFTVEMAALVIAEMANIYPELEKNRAFIVDELKKEEEKFARTLEQGLRELEKLFPTGAAERNSNAVPEKVDAAKAFLIFQSAGFPFEMIQEELAKRTLFVDKEEFDEEFKKHQELSRTASAGSFKGGLADTTDETKKLHTAAHLLDESLRRVLGPHVFQKGSNITPERLRFDFSHGAKMTPEEIAQVENLVNEQIARKLPVHFEEMSLDEAKAVGAIGVFEHKYGDKVKVYFIGNENDYFSKEICGGPHVDNLAELGIFKIIKEEASSSGVRRIKAVLG
jgi:alanyl-tRNA synthetase